VGSKGIQRADAFSYHDWKFVEGLTMKIKITAVVIAGFCTFTQAQTVARVEGGNQAVVADDGLGVELKFDSTGQLLSVKSTFLHPVDFPDRRGINKAYIIAEEKAKANIARYMRQVSSSTRTVREVDDSLSKATRNSSGEGVSWSKENTRKVIESLEEVTGSSAQAVLQGVRILERSYDEKSEEVKVVVGINRQSRAGAAQLEQSVNPAAMSKPGSNQGGAQTFPAQPSERRRAADADKF
jgi:hypothetical protein